MQAHIKGSLELLFYDTEAGRTEVQQVFARPRALASNPYMLEVWVKACHALCTSESSSIKLQTTQLTTTTGILDMLQHSAMSCVEMYLSVWLM